MAHIRYQLALFYLFFPLAAAFFRFRVKPDCLCCRPPSLGQLTDFYRFFVKSLLDFQYIANPDRVTGFYPLPVAVDFAPSYRSVGYRPGLEESGRP